MNLFDKISDKISGRFGEVLGEILLPEDIRVSHERANQAIQREDYSAALLILEAAARTRPEIDRTHYLIGLCHFHSGNFDAALSALETALTLREDAATHLAIALTLERLHRISQAHTHLQHALASGKTSSHSNELESEIRHGLARVYLEQRRADKAIHELRKALRLSPEHPEIALSLAEALLEHGNLDESRELMLSIQGKITSKQALLVMGRIEEANNNQAAARRAYEGVLQHDAGHREALIGAARVCVATSDYVRANEYLLRALEDAPSRERTDIFVLLGQVNEAISNFKTALESYQIALQGDPHQREALLGAGRISLRTHNPTEAADFYARALEASKEDSAREARLGLGKSRLAQGDHAGARRVLEDAHFSTEQRDPEFLHIFAQVALASGDPAEAVVALREALYASDDPAQTALIQQELSHSLARLRPNWTMPETLDNPADVMQALMQLRDFISQNPQLGQFITPVHALINQLDAPLSIAILGEFNAGKSTLINAILGEEVVPTGVLPTTAHPCIMQYGPRKAARIVYLDEQQVEVSFDAARSLMKSEADQIERLDYLYPHPELRSVHFWDTPGFNALDERHEQAAQWALEHAEAILWVLDANQVLSETEFYRIETLAAGNERLIVLINKIDRLGTGEERAAQAQHLLQYVDDHAGSHTAGSFAISGLKALQARKNHDHPESTQLLEESGFEPFWNFLDEHFIQRSGRLKALEVGRQLHLLMDEIHEFGRSLATEYKEYGQKIEELRDWLHQTENEKPASRAQHEAVELSDQFDFVITGVEREISEALVRRGTWSNKMMLDQQDRVFVLNLLQERLESVLERSRHTMLKNITALETELADRLGALLNALSLQDQRAVNRRIESFFDEVRILKLLLTERVYGQLIARARGQIQAGGPSTMREIENVALDDRPSRAALIRELVPGPRTHFRSALTQWLEEFSLAATRFCDRLQRDFMLLELEARYRFDFSELRQTTPSDRSPN